MSDGGVEPGNVSVLAAKTILRLRVKIAYKILGLPDIDGNVVTDPVEVYLAFQVWEEIYLISEDEPGKDEE